MTKQFWPKTRDKLWNMLCFPKKGIFCLAPARTYRHCSFGLTPALIDQTFLGGASLQLLWTSQKMDRSQKVQKIWDFFFTQIHMQPKKQEIGLANYGQYFKQYNSSFGYWNERFFKEKKTNFLSYRPNKWLKNIDQKGHK